MLRLLAAGLVGQFSVIHLIAAAAVVGLTARHSRRPAYPRLFLCKLVRAVPVAQRRELREGIRRLEGIYTRKVGTVAHTPRPLRGAGSPPYRQPGSLWAAIRQALVAHQVIKVATVLEAALAAVLQQSVLVRKAGFRNLAAMVAQEATTEQHQMAPSQVAVAVHLTAAQVARVVLAVFVSGLGKEKNMKAHQIQNGVVVNTIEVDSLDFLPDLIEATEGGIGWMWDGETLTQPPAPPTPIPQVVSRAKFILALLELDLLDEVEAAIAAADRATQINYKERLEFDRNYPLIATMAAVMGKTDAEIDALFVLAATL